MGIKMLVASAGCILLSGCMGIFGFWMNGDPSGGKNITPIRDYWILPGGTIEGRAQTWVVCGGADNGGYHLPQYVSTYAEITTENRKKFYQLQICMMQSGYHYIGSCEGEIASAYPACRNKSTLSE